MAGRRDVQHVHEAPLEASGRGRRLEDLQAGSIAVENKIGEGAADIDAGNEHNGVSLLRRCACGGAAFGQSDLGVAEQTCRPQDKDCQQDCARAISCRPGGAEIARSPMENAALKRAEQFGDQ